MKTLSPTIRLLMCVLALLGVSAACGQSYPTKSVRLIVPYAPGGIVDYVGRLVGQLPDAFGQNVVIDNRPGASDHRHRNHEYRERGWLYAADHGSGDCDQSEPARQSAMDLNRDLRPVTILSSSPLVLVINAKVPANTVQELVNLARSQPGKLALLRRGSAPRLIWRAKCSRREYNKNHSRAMQGSGPAMTDLIAGQVQMSFSSITAALPFIKDGRLRGLATTGEQRARALQSADDCGIRFPGLRSICGSPVRAIPNGRRCRRAGSILNPEKHSNIRK
jgi:tripartite-type tricarboxylate transporter receptor subunit TctC